MNTPSNEKKGRYIHGQNIQNSTIRRKQKQIIFFYGDLNLNPLYFNQWHKSHSTFIVNKTRTCGTEYTDQQTRKTNKKDKIKYIN
jgi:hypothetical protein